MPAKEGERGMKSPLYRLTSTDDEDGAQGRQVAACLALRT